VIGRRGLVALALAALAAAYAGSVVPTDRTPLSALSLVAGHPVGRTQLRGGARLRFGAPDPAAGTAALSARLALLPAGAEAAAFVDGGQVVVDLPEVAREAAADVARLLLREGAIEFREVLADGSLSPEVGLDRRDVAAAEVGRDEYAPEPFLLVTFTADGAQRFAALTERLVGRKLAILVDGAVVSDPVVQEPITGGQARITAGAERAGHPQLDVATLAAALGGPPLPPGLALAGSEAVAPTVTAGQQAAARSLFVGAVGLAVFLLAWALGARSPAPAPISAPAAPAAADGAFRPRPAGPAGRGAPPALLRLLVTLAGAAALPLLGYLPLGVPGVDAGGLAALGGPPLHPFLFGVAPIVTGLVAVEVFALLVPPLRRRRLAGAAARRPLLVAGAGAALVAAALQSWGVAAWLAGFPAVLTARPGLPLVAGVFAAAAAGTAVIAGLWWLAGRFGLGGGYSTLALGTAGASLVGLWRADAAAGAGPAAALWTIGLTAAVAGVALVVLRRPAAADGVTLRRPTSGTVPLPALHQLHVALLWLQVPVWSFSERYPAAWLVVWFLVLGGLTVLAAWLFSRPALLAPLRARAGLAPPAAPPRGLFWRALIPSLLLVWLLAAVGGLTPHLGLALAGYDLALVVVAVAVLLDLAAEWRGRRAVRDAVPVWPLQRVQATDVALSALAARGVPAFVRAAHHRSLLHVFGPHVPATIHVPAAQAAAAEATLRRLLLGDAPAAPAPAPTPAPTPAGDAPPTETTTTGGSPTHAAAR
jgi:hypothetical protein